MTAVCPLAGDLVIRPQGPLEVGLFLVMADQFEHPHRSFVSVSEALAYARHHAELLADLRHSAGIDPASLQLILVHAVRGTARDPKNLRSPLELELWRVRHHDDHTVSCELRCDANGWDVLIRSGGEALFSRRCTREAQPL